MTPTNEAGGVFQAGEISDRGPLERGSTPVPEPRARELRELERQRAWSQQATRALNDYRAEEVDDEADEASPRTLAQPLGYDREDAGGDEFEDEEESLGLRPGRVDRTRGCRR